jgi:hypothetical protein
MHQRQLGIMGSWLLTNPCLDGEGAPVDLGDKLSEVVAYEGTPQLEFLSKLAWFAIGKTAHHIFRAPRRAV